MKTTRWLAVGGIALLLLALGAGLLGPLLWGRTSTWAYNACGWNYGGFAPAPAFGAGVGGWGGMGMMGSNTFGWIGMLVMWLLPLVVVALLVAGGVWLVRAFTHSSNQLATAGLTRNCPTCGQPAQTGWRNCPHCGALLA